MDRQAKRQFATRVVNPYLLSLSAKKKNNSGKRSPERLAAKLETISAKLDTDTTLTPVARLRLYQDRIDITRDLNAATYQPDIDGLVKLFIEVGAEWAKDTGISYQAFRDMGVPTSVLREARIAL
jgi:hypothetical protein